MQSACRLLLTRWILLIDTAPEGTRSQRRLRPAAPPGCYPTAGFLGCPVQMTTQIPHLTWLGDGLVCFQGVSGCRPGVTHDMIGHRTGSRVPSLRVSAAVRCQLWLFSGRRRHGPAWQLGRVAYKPMLQAGSPYARYGSAASANILCRALSSNSYEGWPRGKTDDQPPGVTHHTAR